MSRNVPDDMEEAKRIDEVSGLFNTLHRTQTWLLVSYILTKGLVLWCTKQYTGYLFIYLFS